jgi:capsular exopolysaccharide synthesis family protein
MNNPENNRPQINQNYPPNYNSYYTEFSDIDEGLDLKRYVSLFISNWYWFAISLFMSLGIAYGINRWSEEIFTVSASLLIKDEESSGELKGAEQFIPGGGIFSSRQNLKNEIGVLKSFSLNRDVILELPEFWVTYTSVGKRGIAETKQYKNTPFRVVFDSIQFQRKGQRIDIKIVSADKFVLIIGDTVEREMKFGERYQDQFYDFRIISTNGYSFDPEKSNKYYFWFESPEGLANRYRSRLGVSPIDEEASLVTLSSSGFSVQQEADYLNKLMDVYINQGLELKNKTADRTIAFIDEQLDLISISLQQAEGELESFRLNNELMDLSSEALLLQSKIERFENERFNIEFESKYYKYLLDYIKSKDGSGELVSPSLVGINDPTLSRLVNDLAMLQKQKQQISFSLRQELPAVILLESQIEETSRFLLENVENSLENLNALTTDVNNSIALVEEEIRKLPGKERQLVNIRRKFDLNNTVYNYLLEKRAEAGIAKASNVPDNRPIDKAYAFNASRIEPKERQNIMMALILGLLFPVVFLVVLDLLNNKIIDRRDIEKATDIPLLGFIGHSEVKTEIPVIDSPGSTLAESFRSIRTRLKYFSVTEGSKVIAITSTISGEGKTFISANLAAISAMLGKKVLLIGLDLRKPKLHRLLEMDNGIGLSSYLIGESDFSEIIFKTKIDNLFFCPSGPVPPNPAELIDSDKMIGFFEKVRNEYDFIFVDTPPVAIVTDTLLLSAHIDINLFVVRQRYSSKATLELINELKNQGELKNLAILVNDINLSGYYGYGLRYGNTLGYGGYNYGYNLYGEYGYRKYGFGEKGKEYYQNSK